MLRIDPALAAENSDATLTALAKLKTLSAEQALHRLRQERKLTAPV